jgi:hypothetical protein
MKRHVFIVTNDESHWDDITSALKEAGISFYPEDKEDFRKLRKSLGLFFTTGNEELIYEGESRIERIIDALPQESICLINWEPVEGNFFSGDIFFFKFSEKFNYFKERVKVYFDTCTCDECRDKRKIVEEYCKINKIPTYILWRRRSKGRYGLFTEDLKELPISTLLI